MTARPLDENAGPVVALLSHRPFAWFTDVDGTLSPIVDRPEEATVAPRLRTLADRLARRIDRFVVVSGRTPAHAKEMVGVERAVYVGNHGLGVLQNGRDELIPDAEPFAAAVAKIEPVAAAIDVDGLVIENKGPILALHYRQSSDAVAARQALLVAAQRLATQHGLVVHEGRKVIELRPPLSRDKGQAVRDIVRREGIRAAVYVGDDLTDLDAFRVLRALRETGVAHTVTIAVAATEVDQRVLDEADFRVEGVEGVARLMDAVVDVLVTGEIR